MTITATGGSPIGGWFRTDVLDVVDAIVIQDAVEHLEEWYRAES